MEVYKSRYLDMIFFSKHELIEMTWQAASAEMTEEEYQHEMLNYLALALKRQPDKVIDDSRKMFFSIVSELQEWINRTISPSLSELKISKIAFVINQEMLPKITEGQKNFGLTARYFDNMEEAKQWILPHDQKDNDNKLL